MKEKTILALLLAALSSGSLAASAEPLKRDEAAARQHNDRGIAAAEKGDLAAARAEFLAGYRADPEQTALLFSVGLTYAAEGDEDDAVLYLDKYVEFEPAGLYVRDARERLRGLRESICGRRAKEAEDLRIAQEDSDEVRREESQREESRRHALSEETTRRIRHAEQAGAGLRTGGIAVAAAGSGALLLSAILAAHDGHVGTAVTVTSAAGVSAIVGGSIVYYLGSKARTDARASASFIPLPILGQHGATLDWSGRF